MTYFHGGVPGLKVGDSILPPDKTGTDHTLSKYATQLDGPAHARRTDIVYLTTQRQVAKAYAAFYPDGALYQVLPASPVDRDADCLTPDLSWHCPFAIVVAVVDPVVLFRTRTPERWLRMANGAQS
ncbi:hypothetical protein ABZ819_04950 [Streptomyces venezuelae]|uniref:hypothetical protein n=1 Tax=Streptomyces venezuelae TaxID=54571 RepID=UPI00343E5475